jgi:hypothetical protein
MNNGIKSGEHPTYTFNNCDKTFEPDKNSASVTTGEKETFFCSTDCLRQYWTERDKNNKE